jgi:hypothetical protein
LNFRKETENTSRKKKDPFSATGIQWGGSSMSRDFKPDAKTIEQGSNKYQCHDKEEA